MILYLYHWRFSSGEEFGLYLRREDADQACAGKPGAEVISLQVLAPAPVPGGPPMREGNNPRTGIAWNE